MEYIIVSDTSIIAVNRGRKEKQILFSTVKQTENFRFISIVKCIEM